jgi:putative transposase
MLQQNDVFVHQKTTYRLLQVIYPHAYVISLDAENPVPFQWDASELKESESLKRIDDPYQDAIVSQAAADVASRNLRWSRIQDLVKNPDVYDDKKRWPLLVEHGLRIGVSPKTLLANLRLYWVGGQNEDSLLGRYHMCGILTTDMPGVHILTKRGMRGKTTALFAPAGQKARGRPAANYATFIVTNEDRKRLIAIARMTYAQDDTVSIRALADAVIRARYSERDEDGKLKRDENDNAILFPEGKRPSVEQLRYLIKKAIPISTLNASRTSKASHENNHAPATGTVQDDCIGPGDVYEIDATFLDASIVAMADAFTVIGKPTLYLVVDRDTKLIVGFHLSLENPSFAEAKLAILSIATDWEAVCKRFKVPYHASDWPARGLMPRRFVGDRGEMISFKSDVIAEGMSIAISNPPARRASWKPIVESSFKMTQVALKDNVPGYEPAKNVHSRAGKNYEEKACLNFEKLFRVFLQTVIQHNRASKQGNVVTPAEAFRGQTPSPINKWNRGIESHMGQGKRFKYDYLQRKLSPVGEGKVFVDGIHFMGCVYDFPAAHRNDWMTRASLSKCFPVSVTYSSELVDKVIVQDPFDKHQQYEAMLASESEMLMGYSFAEVKAYNYEKAKLLKKGAATAMAGRISLSESIEEDTAPAAAKVKASRKNRSHSRTFAGPEARADEAFERNKDAHALHGDATLPYYGQLDDEQDIEDVTPKVVSLSDARAARSQPTSSFSAEANSSPAPVEPGAVSTANPDLYSQLMNL